MTMQLFLKPLDTLFFRGNKLFGGPGDFGAALMPPWPSVAAGALRSRMMADAGADAAAFAKGDAALPSPYDRCLGSVEKPGGFRIAGFGVSAGAGQPLYRLPADCIVGTGVDPNGASSGTPVVRRMQPRQLPVIASSYALSAALPVLTQSSQAKASDAYLLTLDGWHCYLRGEALDASYLRAKSELWALEERLGIALDADRRTAADSHIYTSDGVTFRNDAGFWVEVQGADDCLPRRGVVRLGADGRAAEIVEDQPQPTPAVDIPQGGNFKLVLTSPGIFPDGWKPPGIDQDNVWHGPEGRFTARLHCAAVARTEVISGWDLARGKPKSAERAAPAGSVYWFTDFRGDVAALQKLSVDGLWGFDAHNEDRQRRAEGFNNCAIALDRADPRPA